MAKQDTRTVWVGDVESWMDEEFLHRAFSTAGFVTNIKIVRRGSNANGYAFIEFNDPANVSDLVGDVRSYTALGFNFRVNSAQFGVGDMNRKREEHSVYVGGLDFLVKENDLLKTFSERFFLKKTRTRPTSEVSACTIGRKEVIVDSATLMSRGFGFVRFRDPNEAEQAIREMQGVYLGSKQMKVRHSHQRSDAQDKHHNHAPWMITPPPAAVPVVPTATVICINGLDAASAEDLQQLLQRCAAFGAVVRHVFVEASCFVEFQEAAAAEAAASHLSGLCGINVNFSDLSVIEYYRTLQLEGWLPFVEANPVAISNLTTAKAEKALQSVEPGTHEHFKALLKDPNFVRLFEQLVQQQGLKGKVADLWSMLLQDKPDLFNRPMHEVVQAANADVAKAFNGLRMARLASLPEAMRLGL